MPTKNITTDKPGKAAARKQDGAVARTHARPVLHLAVQYAAHPAVVPDRGRIRRWIQAALENNAEMTVRLVDAEEGRMLNQSYRNRDYATNVLTFVYEQTPVCQGDLVLCAPVVEREAAEQGKDLLSHYAHLIVHGTLHLQGYDHENDADAAIMEALETRVLARLGIADPYRIREA